MEAFVKRMLTLALMTGLLNLASYAHPQETTATSDNHRLRRVSLIRVIANPREFDGEHIRVLGYLAGAELDGGPGVFVSESDGRNGIVTNAVDLNVSQGTIRSMYGKYVIVSGLYHAPHGDFNGYIDDILEVKLLNTGNTSK